MENELFNSANHRPYRRETVTFRQFPGKIHARVRDGSKRKSPIFHFPLAALGQSVQVIIPSGVNCSQEAKRPSGDSARARWRPQKYAQLRAVLAAKVLPVETLVLWVDFCS